MKDSCSCNTSLLSKFSIMSQFLKNYLHVSVSVHMSAIVSTGSAYWEWKTGPLQAQCLLLAAEPSPQPLHIYFCYISI